MLVVDEVLAVGRTLGVCTHPSPISAGPRRLLDSLPGGRSPGKALAESPATDEAAKRRPVADPSKRLARIHAYTVQRFASPERDADGAHRFRPAYLR